jgi:3-hydroxypropanoate dehydrogenase
MPAISDSALDQLFRKARTHNAWQDREVPESMLRTLYEMMKWGPTSANCSPLRILFLTTSGAKARLRPHLIGTNVEKTMTAPVTAILAFDTLFYERLPELFPHNPGARDWFAGEEKTGNETAFRNSTLQGAYFIIAARAIGLDCGPMSGFDKDGVDREFFPDGRLRSNFLCNLGYGDPAALFPRSPRLAFDDACEIL